MSQELIAEDLIVTERDGTRRIDHDALVTYGLFSIPKSLMRTALLVYYDNALRQGKEHAQAVRTFIGLANAMRRFPKGISIQFTRGAAYRRNMNLLKRYSR